jgi:hypothetical protein
MRVCIADRDRDALRAAEVELASLAPNGATDIVGVETDVSSISDIDLMLFFAWPPAR